MTKEDDLIPFLTKFVKRKKLTLIYEFIVTKLTHYFAVSETT